MIFLVKCKKPKGYRDTKIVFPSYEKAKEYVSDLDEKYEVKRLKALEFPLSKRMRKKVQYSRPKNYAINKIGNKYKLWEELP